MTACLLLIAAVATVVPAAEQHRLADGAIEKSREFLQGRIDHYGMCVDEYPTDHQRNLHGGRTALTAYALLASGLDRNDPTLEQCLHWLLEADLDGVFPVAMRAKAFALVPGEQFHEQLVADAEWLIGAASEDGTYTYTPCDGETGSRYDNTTTHAAMMAVAAADARGVEVPQSYWRTMERHWASEQQGDGGFGYRIPPGRLRARTYGSMTAAGLEAASVCFDKLHRERFILCRPVETPRLLTGPVEWLERNFAADVNPELGVQWYYYWLYTLGRAARRTGLVRLGDRDWYAEGIAELLDRQRSDGSFGVGERVEETALALIFLSSGRAPVVVNKLSYTGQWNPRPHDAANLADWLAYAFEMPINWGQVSVDDPVEDLCAAPILYISGAGPARFDSEHKEKLRRFVLRGGMIVSESAGNSGEFSLDMQRLMRRLFPEYPLRRLDADHPIHTHHYNLEDPPALYAVSNGVRLLAVHSPTELSLGLQLGQSEQTRPSFEQFANIFLLATGGGQLRPGGFPEEPDAEPIEPRATIRVARISHNANPDPEPLAWPRLAHLMAQRHRIRLVVSEPMSPTRLDPDDWPIAAMTGTEELVLSDVERAALDDYLSRGGTLVIDAAGGSPAFADSARRQILPIAGRSRPARWTPLAGPEDLSEIRYRLDYALALDERRYEPRLTAVTRQGRLAVVFSPEDITAGLVGYEYTGIRGYAPETAVALMTNILCHLAGVQAD